MRHHSGANGAVIAATPVMPYAHAMKVGSSRDPESNSALASFGLGLDP